MLLFPVTSSFSSSYLTEFQIVMNQFTSHRRFNQPTPSHIDGRSNLSSDSDHSLLSDDFQRLPQSSSPPPQPLFEEMKWPSGATVKNHINNLPNNHINNLTKQAWEALLKKNKHPHAYSNDWFPFINGLCTFLFVGRYDPKIGLTRAVVDFIIVIFKSLKQAGIIANDYYVPASGALIEEYWENLPQVPLCLFYFSFSAEWFEVLLFFLSLH